MVAVSKTKPAELIEGCYQQEQRHFGENYVQEVREILIFWKTRNFFQLEEKSAALAEKCPEIKWHFIGQVQSNKVSKIGKK